MPSIADTQQLRPEIHIRMAEELPEGSTGYRADADERYALIKDSGYKSVQGGDAILCGKHCLRFSRLSRVNDPADIYLTARKHQDEGSDYTVLHAGWGIEHDSFLDAYAEAIIEASKTLNYPILLETHRATITQDNWRTIELIRRHPDLRFNLDFSHYYTGHEMTNGPWEDKMAFLLPLFERSSALHGRIGTSGCIQTRFPPSDERALRHYQEAWVRTMHAFIQRKGRNKALPFTVELLPAHINYARSFQTSTGLSEESDRWRDGLQLVNFAQSCMQLALEYDAQNTYPWLDEHTNEKA